MLPICLCVVATASTPPRLYKSVNKYYLSNDNVNQTKLQHDKKLILKTSRYFTND